MYSAVAAKKPGVITKVGLHTYIDPRLDGGKMNDITTERAGQNPEIEGRNGFFSPVFHFDVAFVKGTTADTQREHHLRAKARSWKTYQLRRLPEIAALS